MRNAMLIALTIVSAARAYVGDWTTYTAFRDIRAFASAKGFLFTATAGGIRKLNPSTRAESAYRNHEGLRDVGINALATSPEGDVFAASELGFLYQYNWGSDSWEVLEAGYKGAGWHLNKRALLYRSGYLVVGSDKGLSFYNVKKRVAEANVTKLETVSGMSVNSLLFVGDTLFTGTSLGIFRAVLHFDRLLTDPQVNIFNPAIWTKVVTGGLYFDPTLADAPQDSNTVAADTGLHLPPDANQDHAHGVLYYGPKGIASDYDGVVLTDPPARISRNRSTFEVDGKVFPDTLNMGTIGKVGDHWYVGRFDFMYEFFPRDTAAYVALVNPLGLPYQQITATKANRYGVYGYANPQMFKLRGQEWDTAGGAFQILDDNSEWTGRGLHNFDIPGPDEVVLGTWGSGIRYRRGNVTLSLDATNSCMVSSVDKDPNYPAIEAMAAYRDKGYFFTILRTNTKYQLVYFDRATRQLTCPQTDEQGTQQGRGLQVVGDTMLVVVTDRGLEAYRIRDQGGKVSVEPGNRLPHLLTSPSPTLAGSADAYGNFWITTEGSDLLYVNDLANHPDSVKTYHTLDGFSGVSCKNLERDPSGHLWSGCTEGGVFEVIPGKDSSLHTFRKYGLNDGLLSETIFNLSVNPDNGDVWVSTDKGIARYESFSRPLRPNLSDVKAYPNPFLPKHRVVVFDNLAAGSEVQVLTQAGEVVFRRTLSKGGAGDQIQWDGRNPSGKRVTEGVYFYVVKTSKETKHGKLIVAR